MAIGESPEEVANELASMYRGDGYGHYQAASDALLSRDDAFVCLTLRAMEARLRGQYYGQDNARGCSYFFERVAVQLVRSAPPLRRGIYVTACEMQFRHGQSHSARHGTLDTLRHLTAQDGDVAAELLARITDTDCFQEAIEHCVFLKVDSVIEFLHTVVSDSRAIVRLAVVRTLGTLADPRSFNVVLPLLDDHKDYVRLAAIETLFSLDPSQACRKAHRLKSGSARMVTLRLVQLLGEAAEPHGLTALRSFLGHSTDADVRLFAARSIGMIRPAVAPPELIKALGDPNTSVRGMAAWALGEISDQAAEMALDRLHSETDGFTRWSAAKALRKIRASRSVVNTPRF